MTVADRQETRPLRIDTPLSLVGMSQPLGPSKLIARVGERKFLLSGEGSAVVRQQPAEHVRMSGQSFGTADWFFGPNIGYLPAKSSLQLISKSGQAYPQIQTFVLEAKNLESQGFFPTHVMQVFAGDHEKAPVRVVEIRVTELTNKVTEDDLSIEVPAGTSVLWKNEENHNDSHFRTRQKEKLRPDDIPRLMQMLEKKTAEPLMDTAIQVESSGLSKWYVAGAIVAVFVVAIFLFRRFRVRST